MLKKIVKCTLMIIALLILLSTIPVFAADLFDIAEEVQPILKGSKYQLTLSYSSADVKKDIIWSSDDESIATVSADGLINAKGLGTVTIKADYKNGTHIDTIKVLVLNKVEKVWAKKNGNWYLMSNTNYLSGWQQVGKAWYYMDDSGVMQTSWQNINKTWYYLGTSGEMQTGWQYIDNKWYFLRDSGAMQTGWLQRGKTWYYLSKTGAMATGWIKVDNNWYFMDDFGEMRTGWQLINDNWYLFDDSGVMLTGWQKIGNTWYYMNPSGLMMTGWQKINGSWYYLNSSGAMLTGWQKIDARWYYLNYSGVMLTGWQYINGDWYLMGDSGWMLTGWQCINGVWYYLQSSGKMATETCVIDGYSHVFKTNGDWISTYAMDQKANYGTGGKGYKSNTNYLILVNLVDKVTKIYKKSGQEWKVEKAWLCTVGDSSKDWSTVSGEFYIGQSTEGYSYTRGSSFNDYEGHTLYYWTRFYNGYLFHSILYDEGTYNVSLYGNELGEELSHGCVRLRIENAKWIYDNIPDNTKVIVY